MWIMLTLCYKIICLRYTGKKLGSKLEPSKEIKLSSHASNNSSSSASEYLRNTSEQLFGRLPFYDLSFTTCSKWVESKNKLIYTCKSCGLHARVYADPYVSPEVVDWTEVRMVWAQNGCPTLPSVGRLVNKKINKDTPYNSDVTHHLCSSSSAHVKMIPLGKRHWLDPLCWFTCDPHWCTRFCASCASNGSGTGTETVVHASHSLPCLKTSMCMHTVMQGNCSAAKL